MIQILSQTSRNFLKFLFYKFNWCRFLLRSSAQGIKVGPFHSSVKIRNPKGLLLGQKTSVNQGVFFDNNANENSIRIGDSVKVGDRCRFTTYQAHDQITIGENTSIHGDCHINGEVEIGRGCLIARNIFLASNSHQFRLAPQLTIREQDALAQKQGLKTSQKITIGHDVWLSWGCVVLPGVHVADGCVIGANAVVTKNTEPYGVYGGVPAKKIGDRRNQK